MTGFWFFGLAGRNPIASNTMDVNGYEKLHTRFGGRNGTFESKSPSSRAENYRHCFCHVLSPLVARHSSPVCSDTCLSPVAVPPCFPVRTSLPSMWPPLQPCSKSQSPGLENYSKAIGFLQSHSLFLCSSLTYCTMTGGPRFRLTFNFDAIKVVKRRGWGMEQGVATQEARLALLHCPKTQSMYVTLFDMSVTVAN